MIKTTKQYNATKENLKKLHDSLVELKKSKESKDPLEYQLEFSGLNNLSKQLQSEMSEYECLVNPDNTSMTFDCEVQDFPELLIKARLVRNMSQKDLGEKIGVDAQQIQRYETNSYEGVGFARLLEIQYALGLDINCKASIINNDIFLIPNDMTEEDVNEKETIIRTHHLFA